MKIRALNELGVLRFKDWLDVIKSGGGAPKPEALLTDPSASYPIDSANEIEHRSFANRYELAAYIDRSLSQISIQQLPMTHGIWAWLSLFYIDVLSPPRSDGTRSLNELVRYIPTTDYQKYYRHLIGFGVHAIRQLGEDAKPLLVSTKPGILHTDYCEQIYGYQDLCQTRAFISVANSLYYDPLSERIKPRAASNKKNPGTLRRLGDVFYQLDLTYDVQGMNWREFQKLLPPEFASWLPSSS